MSKPPISQRIAQTWRPVEGWPYYVSDEGQVWSEHTDKVLRPYPNETGAYLVVDLRDDGARKQKYVHVLVLEAHRGERPTSKHEANHRDGDPKNNALSNLEWIEAEDHDDLSDAGSDPLASSAPF